MYSLLEKHMNNVGWKLTDAQACAQFLSARRLHVSPDLPSQHLGVVMSELRYRYITGPDDRSFCERISAALDEGYQLYGSPTLTFNGERTIAAQAVIKEPKQ